MSDLPANTGHVTGDTVQAEDVNALARALNQFNPTAKGQIVVGSGPNAPYLVNVGVDGQILIADSSQAMGVKWGAPIGATGATGPTGPAVALSSINPLMDGAVSVGVSLIASREDHRHASDTSRAALTTNTFTGLQSIVLGSDTVGLIVKGTAGQTANLQEWQSSSGTIQSRINSAGTFLTNGGSYIENTGRAFFNASVASYVPLTAKGTTSQTGNLTEWQDSTGAILTRVNSSGNIISTVHARFPFISNSGLTGARVNLNDSGTESGAVVVTTQADANKGLIVRGNSATQSNYLFQAQDYSSATYFYINQYGNVGAAQGVIITGGVANSGAAQSQLSIISGGTTNKLVVLQAAASQTANLFEAQDSSGGLKVQIDNVGGLQTYNFATFRAGAAGTVPFIVRGAAAQTGDLTQYQDSSFTVLAKVASDGTITAPQFKITAGNSIGTSAGTGPYLVFDTTNARILTRADANTGLIIRGNTSQSANLQEWQNSSSTVLSAITAGGMAQLQGVQVTGATVPANGMYLPSANTLGFSTNSVANRLNIDANGNVAFGTTTNVAMSVLAYKNITGGTTAYGIIEQGTVQSDVTSSARIFESNVATQATTFTLSNLYHFYANPGTFGAGSTVTNQMGFIVPSAFTSATNNYGFYGNIAAASSRWNAYMAGTAANYFAGQTTVGSTSLTLGSGSVAQQFGVVTTATTNVAVVIQGMASQTADLLQLQNSSGTILMSFGSGGAILIAPTDSTSAFAIQNSAGAATGKVIIVDTTNRRVMVGGGNSSLPQTELHVAKYTSSDVSIRVDQAGYNGAAIVSLTAQFNGGALINSGAGYLLISNNGTERMRFSATGGQTYFGNGDVNASPVSTTIFATGGSGTNIAGANLSINGGIGTGTGIGGYIRFLTAPAGSTGSVANTSVEQLRIDSTGLVSVKGSFGRTAPTTTSASTYTILSTDNYLICNGAATCTVTLPTASSWTGREITIKTTVNFTVVSASSNVVPIGGGAAGTAILAATAGKFVTLVSDGTNWITIAAN